MQKLYLFIIPLCEHVRVCLVFCGALNLEVMILPETPVNLVCVCVCFCLLIVQWSFETIHQLEGSWDLTTPQLCVRTLPGFLQELFRLECLFYMSLRPFRAAKCLSNLNYPKYVYLLNLSLFIINNLILVIFLLHGSFTAQKTRKLTFATYP